MLFALLLLFAPLASALPLPRHSLTPRAGLPQERDDTATRAFTAQPITTSNGWCLDVNDVSAADSRGNNIPVQVKPCDGSLGQQFDVITQGKHISAPGFAILVSSKTNGCVDIRTGNGQAENARLFACGGRADGDGIESRSQLMKFSGGAGPLAFAVQSGLVNNGAGPGSVCLSPNGGFLGQSQCDPLNPAPEQLFRIEGTSNPVDPPTPTTSATSELPTTPTTTSPAAPATSNTTGGVALQAGLLPFDPTATTAVVDALIRTTSGSNLCWDVSDKSAGDDRLNKIPIALKPCDQANVAQQFSLVTEGVHNNRPDPNTVIIISTETTTRCVDRRTAGGQPGLFACGGRADGDGTVSFDQQYIFNPETADLNSLAFVLQNGRVNDGVGPGNTCLTDNGNGQLVNAPCSPPNFLPTQLWSVGR